MSLAKDRLNAFTVIGLTNTDSGEFMIAAVVQGSGFELVDENSNSGQYGDYQRIAHNVQARDADHAEELATILEAG